MSVARLVPLGAVLVAALAAGCGSNDPSISSACATPTTEVSATTVHPGETVVVVSSDQFDVSGDDVCPDDGRGSATWTPRTGLDITWQQGNTVVDLGSGDADADGELTTTVTVPANALPGEATIAVEHANAATVDVVR